MKLTVYKMYFFDLDGADTKQDVFRLVEVLSEKELYKRFKQAIDDEQLSYGVMDDYDLTTTDPDTFTPDEIIEIFEEDGYTIQKTFVEI